MQMHDQRIDAKRNLCRKLDAPKMIGEAGYDVLDVQQTMNMG